MTCREQAEALDSHTSQIARWRKRGMPADMAGADLWLRRNVVRRQYLRARHRPFVFQPAPLDLSTSIKPGDNLADLDAELSPEDVSAACRAVLDGADAFVANLANDLNRALWDKLNVAQLAAVHRAACDWCAKYSTARARGFQS